MTPTPLAEIPESLVAFNRERYKQELAQGIHELMRAKKISRARLAELLDVNRSRVSHMLSGFVKNLRAETLADVFLVMGYTPHLTIGTDLEQIRLPVIEPDSQGQTVTRVDLGPYAIGDYSHLSASSKTETSLQLTAPGATQAIKA